MKTLEYRVQLAGSFLCLNNGVGIDVMLGSRYFVGAKYNARDLEGAVNATQIQATNLQAMQIRGGIKF